jgi:predicted metalloprotease with PDZ domain
MNDRINRLICSFILLSTMTFAQQPSVHYTLGMSKPVSHLLEVEMTIDRLPAAEQAVDFILPVWRPGRYLVLDLAGGVQNFSAAGAEGKTLAWEKVEKSLWRVRTNGTPRVTIRYSVYANEFNLRTRGLNEDHAFVDGTAVFMYVEKYRGLPVELTVNPYKNWHATTGLDGNGRSFSARDYDYFVDCPIEVGTQKDFTFDVDGIPHVLSISGAGDWNADTLIRDIGKIIATERNFWGEYPYKRYVFLVHCTTESGGGTEHINSTILGTRPFIFKNPDSYWGFLNLVAHEYFHTWNVKQLRPKSLRPYDYTRENYCRELWIAEGTTSYYDNLMLVRAGFTRPEKFLEGAATAIQSDRQRPGNRVQPLVESSFDAWIKYWRGTEQSFNAESDYYGKGANVSALLDLDIRERSANKHSLDDVMRTMYKRFPLSGGGYTLADFQKVAEEFAGVSLQRFFDDYVFGTAPLPWEEYLGYAGLKLARKDSLAKPWIGLSTTDAGEKTKVTQVVAGSPASEAGIDPGDEILAMDGYRVRSSDLGERISRLAEGEVVTLMTFQRDRLRECKLKVAHSPVPEYRIVKTPDPSGLQRDMYRSWLGAPFDSAPVSH